MAIEELYEEGSGSWDKDRKGRTGPRKFICDNYANAEAEAPQLGDPWPGKPEMRAVRIHCDGHGAAMPPVGVDVISWSHALITVDYADRSIETEGMVIESVEHSLEMLSLPEGAFTFDSDGSVVREPVAMPVPHEEINIRQVQQTLNLTAIRSCMGRVNAYSWRNCPAESVIYMGCSRSELLDAELGIRWEIMHKFIYNPFGWNNLPRFDTNPISWQPVSPRPFGLAQFSVLGV